MATSNTAASRSLLFGEPREDWLALRQEDVIDPERPIVDAHHHLWDRGGQRYMIEEITGDIASGHNIVATVYVDCRSMYRAGGPEALRPVGEVEFANGVAAMSASGGYGSTALCAGIVGHANLLLGEAARAVLEAEIAAGNGRFRGIRHASAWDADASIGGNYSTRPKGLLLDTTFRKGFACLAPLGSRVSMRGCFIRRSANSPIWPAPFRTRESCSIIAAARSASAAMRTGARRFSRSGRHRSGKSPNAAMSW